MKMAMPATRTTRHPRVSMIQPVGGRSTMAIIAKSPMIRPIWKEVPPIAATYSGITGRIR